MVNELLRPLDAAHSQHRLAALLDSVMAISADLELSEVLDRIVKVACELLGARYGALGVLGSDGKHLSEFVTQGITPQEREDIGGLPRGHGVLGLLIRDPRPRRSQDIADDPHASGFPPNHPPMRSFLGVPIRVRDQVFGNLYMAEKQNQVEFSEEDEAILVALATAAGIAIDNARRYEQSRRHRRWAETSAEMTQFLLEGREEASALTVVASRVLNLTQAELAVVALYDETGELVIRAGQRSPQAHEDGSSNGMGGSVRRAQRRELAASGEPVPLMSRPEGRSSSELVAELCELYDLAPHGPTEVLPLTVGDQSVGVLAVVWEAAPQPFVADLLPTLEVFAQQAGLALVAARARQDRSRMTLLEERDRIAREMNDNVIQRLFATGLSLQSATPLAQHPTVRNRLEEAVEELDAAIKDVRHAIFELHTVRDPGELEQEIRKLIRAAGDALGFTPDLEIDPSVAGFSQGLEADVVAVVREGLANVVRHAQATQVLVRVTSSGDVVVSDNGVGLSADLTRSGLANLAERAQARGGSLSLKPREPHGTVLSWVVS
jgi:signal transduction histidine kinase